VTTLRGRLDLKDLAEVYRRWPLYPLVSISRSQRKPLPLANWVATVPHGVSEGLYRFTAKPEGGYLAFLGRISPEKRPDRAIAIAERMGLKLKIAAKVDAADRKYFREVIEPLLSDPLIEFVGEIGDSEKSAFLGDAAALLFPIDWPEPFGLVRPAPKRSAHRRKRARRPMAGMMLHQSLPSRKRGTVRGTTGWWATRRSI
jgi:glycosyltransferase involved in cell wall biosynthesis